MRCVRVAGMLMRLQESACSASAAEPLPRPQGPAIRTTSGHIAQTNVPGPAGSAEFCWRPRDMPRTQILPAYGEIDDIRGKPARAVSGGWTHRGRIMKATALKRYRTSISKADHHSVPILATEAGGMVSTLRDKGALRIVHPRDRFPALRDMTYDPPRGWRLRELHIE